MKTIIIKHTAVTLDGNRISGNTYPVKEYIKAYLGGKWDSNSKVWIVDQSRVDDLIARQAITVDDSEPVTNTHLTDMQRGIWQRNGELTEDY